MNTRLKTLMAVGILAGFAAPASALPLLEIVPSAGLPTPVNMFSYPFHSYAPTAGLSGYVGANLKALGTLGIEVKLQLLYADPIGDPRVITNGYTHPLSTFSWPGHIVDGGETATGNWVDFAIKNLANGKTVVNGSNPGYSPYGTPNFFLAYANAEKTAVVVALEDGMQPLVDGSIGDFDDVIFLITAKPVSEPAALSLLGAGLLLTGVGVRSRRRNLARAV